VVVSTTTVVEQIDEEPEPGGATILTPVVAVARSRYAVPGLGAVALGSALGVLEITKRPRRRGRTGDSGAIALLEAE